MGQTSVYRDLCDAEGKLLSGRLIDVSGYDTYVVEGGSGPCVLFLHGFGDSVASWRRVLPALTRDHRVVAVDLPGFGRSKKPKGVDLIEYYESFFPQLAEQLDIDNATVVGHSLGGAVALTVALERPDLVDRVALIAPAGLGDAPPWWWHAIAGTYINWQAMLLLPNPLAKTVIRGALRSFLKQTLVYDLRQLEHLVDEFVERHGGRRELANLIGAGKSLIRGYDGKLLERSRKELSMPVRVIWGRQDKLASPDHAPQFASSVPHSDVFLLDQCGHYPQMEYPTQINQLLGEFIGANQVKGPPKRRRRRSEPHSLRQRVS